MLLVVVAREVGDGHDNDPDDTDKPERVARRGREAGAGCQLVHIKLVASGDLRLLVGVAVAVVRMGMSCADRAHLRPSGVFVVGAGCDAAGEDAGAEFVPAAGSCQLFCKTRT